MESKDPADAATLSAHASFSGTLRVGEDLEESGPY